MELEQEEHLQPMQPALIALYSDLEDFDPDDPTLAPQLLFDTIMSFPSYYVHTKIREWVQWGGAATATDVDGTTILSVCAAHNRPGAVRYLLQHGANVPMGGGWESTATEALSSFCGSLHSDNLQIAGDLINAGANINFEGCGYRTPLMYAAEKVKVGLVHFLLQHGAKVDATNKSGHDAAALARKGYGSSIPGDPGLGDFLSKVKRAGGYELFVRRGARIRLIVLRVLCERGRATPPADNILARAMVCLPKEIFWHLTSYWRAVVPGSMQCVV